MFGFGLVLWCLRRVLKIPKGQSVTVYDEEQTTQWPKEKVQKDKQRSTFNNISVISWRSVLLVEETGENHRSVASNRHTLSHNVVSSTPRLGGVRAHNFRGDGH